LTHPLPLAPLLPALDAPRYLDEQRRLYGRRPVLLLPGDAPREVLAALDLLPVEVWGGGEEPAVPRCPRLPPFVCSLAQRQLQRLLAAATESVAAVVLPGLCDTQQGLGSLLAEALGPSLPVLTYDPGISVWSPRGGAAPEPVAEALDPFRKAELELFVQACEGIAGRKLQPERLATELRLQEEAQRLALALYRRRAGLVLGERPFGELLRTREFLTTADWLRRLQDAQALVVQASGSLPARRPVLLSGIAPEPMELLDLVEAAGLTVVGDDLLCLGRRWTVRARAAQCPEGRELAGRAQLLRELAALPPAPTRTGGGVSRASWLLAEVHRSEAQGVLVLVPRCCEPELCGVPELTASLARARVPLLVVEHEPGAPLAGDLATRLTAFAGLLSAAGCPGGGGP